MCTRTNKQRAAYNKYKNNKSGSVSVRFSEFQEKEVINACDCCKLGYVEDLVIDEKKGKIEAIIIPKGRGICNFFCEDGEYIIPFACIKRIGPDIILVEMHEEK